MFIGMHSNGKLPGMYIEQLRYFNSIIHNVQKDPSQCNLAFCVFKGHTKKYQFHSQDRKK
jgi:hypothetical protein